MSTQTFSLGYIKPFPKFRFGSSDNAFGMPGAAGSFGIADPDTGIGIAYAMNKAGFHLYNDPRGRPIPISRRLAGKSCR
jgi:CubicO group peptidase (beta-lactamase class C family)